MKMIKSDIVLEEKALEAGEPTELGQNEAKAQKSAGCLHQAFGYQYNDV